MKIIDWPNCQNRIHCSFLLLALLLTACSSSDSVQDAESPEPSEIANMPAQCESLGLGQNHPHNLTYQGLLDDIVSHGFPGVTAAVYTPNTGLWVGAAGKANIEKNISMQTCNVLFSGSVAKTYTVTAAMILHEYGLLSLDDPIRNFLPESVVANLPNAQTATIRQLMNHTAGMPDHDNEESLDEYLLETNGRLPSAEEQLSTLYDNEPLFEPGAGVEYSSAHTLVLSLIIDKIAGEHHGNIISRDIIQKLNLASTYYKYEEGLPKPENLVEGYIMESGSVENYTEASVNYATTSQGDAGVMATAYDYYRFIKALMTGELVDQATIDLMSETAALFSDDTVTVGFGLGLITTLVNDEMVKVGHSGATLGGLSHVYSYPTAGSYLVLLTNMLPVDGGPLNQYWGGGWISSEESAVSGFESLIFDELQIVEG